MDLQPFFLSFDLSDSGFQPDVIVLTWNVAVKGFNQVTVGSSHQPVKHFNNRDFGPHRPVNGRHLETDDSTSDDQHRFRDFLKI